MEVYEDLEVEVVEFDEADLIITSSCDAHDCPAEQS